MPVINARDLKPFPQGDNDTSTIINEVIFNLTALKHFNYTLYTNNTISNNSKCYLIFDKYKPQMLSNGTWLNATTCYIPYYGIGERGITSIAFGALFGMSIMFTLINLRKHGKLYLREDKRFRVVGRRWQWYWMLFAAACGMISTLTGVDVDRYYLQQVPIILQSFFYTLMVPGALAMVWEAVRHWGSWQERQIVDVDPTLLPQTGPRERTEFYLPLIFYLFAWMNFFMTIPRSWTALQKQSSPEQKNDIAKPSATGPRGKAGAIIAAVAWFVICYSLLHSIKWYKTRGAGFGGKISGVFRHTPAKLFFAMVLLAIRIGYGIASAWFWDLSIFQDGVQIGWPFGLGYAPILLIIIVFEIAGFVEENEDKVLIKQRAQRGQAHDAELNIIRKPNWWSKNYANRYQTEEQRLRNMTSEVGGGRPTARNVDQGIEMGNMNVRNRSKSRPLEDPFRDQSADSSRQSSLLPPRPGAGRTDSETGSTMTGQTLTAENAEAAPQQRIRSMLDV